MTRIVDVDLVNKVKPDYAGFVVDYPLSRRSLSLGAARRLTERLDRSIRSVGVFVDAAPETIADALNADIFDVAQLHGNREDRDYIRRLRALVGDRTIVRAVVVDSQESVRSAAVCGADRVLFDAGRGCGSTFDTSALTDFHEPFWLAGGLNLANVAAILSTLTPSVVDVSSGVETNGFKDPEKVERFVEIVRAFSVERR